MSGHPAIPGHSGKPIQRIHPAGRVSIDVIIVNWNAGDLVVEAARSAALIGAQAIVVDNGSTDGSLDRLVSEVPDVRVVLMGYNAGFARACNAGTSVGSGEFVFLLNPDASIVEGTADDVGAAFQFTPSVAIVGTRMVDEAGRWVPSVRRFPSTVSLCLYQLKLRPLARWLPPLRRYLMMDFDGSRPALIDQPMGAAFIMRRSDWETFGGLDEQFFLWFEEVDLACRVARVGGKSLYWPSIVVRHQEGTSFRQLPRIQRQRIWNRSMLAYARRHLGRPQTFVLRATVPISLILAAVIDRLPPAMVDPHRKIAAAP